MQERKFYSAGNQEKRAYALKRHEANALFENIERFAHVGFVALIKTNDPGNKRRPRLEHNRDKIEMLHEVLGEDAVSPPEMSDFDVLRYDLYEVKEALRDPLHSGLERSEDEVVLGLPTMAMALNTIRPAVMNNSKELKAPRLIRTMIDQFYEEGAQRVVDQVQV